MYFILQISDYSKTKLKVFIVFVMLLPYEDFLQNIIYLNCQLSVTVGTI